MSTYTNFTIETDADGIALVTWDMPEKSMNVFTAEVLEELNAIVDATVADGAVKGVVFTSGKSSFSGGADLSMLKSMFALYNDEKAKSPDAAAAKLFELVGRMTGLFRKIETNGKPWVSAINGTCMGGAFELSLACHGRVASSTKSLKIALPEVKVGIFPGSQAAPARLAPDRCTIGLADDDDRAIPDRRARQGHGAGASGGGAGSAGRNRKTDDQGRPEAGRTLG